MLAPSFERKAIYLSDNATQTKMTENMVEMKKILKKLGYINFDLWDVTYMTIVNLLPQRQVLTHNEAVHNHYLNSKIN